MGFLNARISTLAGIIIIFLISLAVGAAVIYQWSRLLAISSLGV